MSTPIHVENDSALARVFKDKKKSRQRLGQLWEENSRLEKLVTSNKEEQVRLEQSVRGNKMELGRLEVLINVNRGEILQATQENEKLDKKLEITVMERVEPQPVLVRDNGMEKDYVKERLAEKTFVNPETRLQKVEEICLNTRLSWQRCWSKKELLDICMR